MDRDHSSFHSAGRRAWSSERFRGGIDGPPYKSYLTCAYVSFLVCYARKYIEGFVATGWICGQWLVKPAGDVLGRGDGPSRMGLANHRPQHGLIDYESAVGMLQAISTTRTVPLVRVPWTDGPGYRHESAGRGRLRCDLSHDQFCRGSANSLRLVATRPRAYEVVARLAQTSMPVRTTLPTQIGRSSPWQ